MADDDASDDLKDESIEEEAMEPAADERRGVDSVAGGSPLLVLASRLHTGQNVLHEVSQASTHIAWNSENSHEIHQLRWSLYNKA